MHLEPLVEQSRVPNRGRSAYFAMDLDRISERVPYSCLGGGGVLEMLASLESCRRRLNCASRVA